MRPRHVRAASSVRRRCAPPRVLPRGHASRPALPRGPGCPAVTVRSLGRRGSARSSRSLVRQVLVAPHEREFGSRRTPRRGWRGGATCRSGCVRSRRPVGGASRCGPQSPTVCPVRSANSSAKTSWVVWPGRYGGVYAGGRSSVRDGLCCIQRDSETMQDEDRC
jgi:hypothetical protein